ncbi:MAG TPA: esterase-like activity of phytase family protein, partial [Flavisolibacter sp.]|nr:esterase-like activity of phytase family protein [Flavisolibacter sp.]
MHFLYRLSAITSLFLTIISCTAARKAADTNINGLRFIGEYTIPSDQLFKGTTVGGLSGIDYDPKKDVYYFISDDRSDINPIRFYTAKIRIAANGIEDVKFTTVTNLLQKTGLPFYNRKQNTLGVPDPEGIRINHITQSLAWVSEGERTVNKEKTVLTDPAVIVSRTNGEWTDSFPLPANFRMMATDTGPRNNEALEALAFSTDFKKLLVGLEGPLYEDGPRAGLFDSTGWVRICQYDAVTKKLEAQWAYQIDPVA